MLISVKELLENVMLRFRNELPKKKISEFELGVLVGQQEVADYIYSIIEKKELAEKENK